MKVMIIATDNVEAGHKLIKQHDTSETGVGKGYPQGWDLDIELFDWMLKLSI